MRKTEPRSRREPDETAFHRLLEWLDQGSDSEGQRYVEIRERLVLYFARRNCPGPEDLADETLNRVARRLKEQGTIDDILPAQYCYGVARFVMLEALRQMHREATGIAHEHRSEFSSRPEREDGTAERERTMDCLEECLAAHTAADRELILAYYRTDAGTARAQRKRLAERLGLTANSLAIRAWRLRQRLERCVRHCRERRQNNGSFVSSR